MQSRTSSERTQASSGSLQLNTKPNKRDWVLSKKHENRKSFGGRFSGCYLPRLETFCHQGAEWLCWPKPRSYFLKLDRREQHEVEVICWDNIFFSLDGALYWSGSAAKKLQYQSLTPHEWSPVCSKMSLIILKNVSGLDNSDYDGIVTVVRVIINGGEVVKVLKNEAKIWTADWSWATLTAEKPWGRGAVQHIPSVETSKSHNP